FGHHVYTCSSTCRTQSRYNFTTHSRPEQIGNLGKHRHQSLPGQLFLSSSPSTLLSLTNTTTTTTLFPTLEKWKPERTISTTFHSRHVLRRGRSINVTGRHFSITFVV